MWGKRKKRDTLTDSMTIILSVDMAKKYGLENNGNAADAPLTLKKGQIMVNGHHLLTRHEARNEVACHKRGITVNWPDVPLLSCGVS